MIYTVTLNPALDYVVHLPDGLTEGSVNRAGHTEVQFGGKGINVSCLLHQLGIPSTILGFVAGAAGARLTQMLQQQGLMTDFITLPQGETRINVKLKAGVETDINAPGPAVALCQMQALREKLRALQAGDVLVLAGSLPGTLPPDTYKTLLADTKQQNIMAVVDAEGPLLEKTLPYHPFLIKPNREELGALFGRTLRTDEEAVACAAELQKRGARNVLVSLGAGGALLRDEAGHVYRAEAPAGQAVNCVGAGDSMVAGFLAGWLQDHSYETALIWGTAAGSATAFSEGLADAKKISRVKEQMQKNSIFLHKGKIL